MQFHEIANIFPLIQGAEFDELVTDITKNGLLEPIVLHEGKILDGRNRYNACQKAGISPNTVVYDGDDPLGHVISLNVHRRHLASDQRAAAAIEAEAIADRFREEAKARQLATLKQNAEPTVSQKIDTRFNRNPNRTDHKLAETFGTNRQYIADIRKVRDTDPDGFEAIKQGAVKLAHVKREIKESQRESERQKNRQKIVTSPNPAKLPGAYSTIVIDPPWDWGDEGDNDQLGRARPDYHTLSLDQIKKLPVRNLANENAHIYLWITNRSLPKGFDLLEAWGFRYITALTWVKPYFGMGNYFRGQTEHILFGVRGSMPLKRKDQGTVFHENRGPNGHSSKPIGFYDLVESCSHGPYLEMFSRTDKRDWTQWGESSNAARI